jgi:hypothetical protein
MQHFGCFCPSVFNEPISRLDQSKQPSHVRPAERKENKRKEQQDEAATDKCSAMECDKSNQEDNRIPVNGK